MMCFLLGLVEVEGENRPRQGESRQEMYTCDQCNKRFEILHDYIRHKDFECSVSELKIVKIPQNKF